MHSNLTIAPLALHPEALPVLVSWYETEWPAWYGSGRGNARHDLQAFSNQGSLPVGDFYEPRLWGLTPLFRRQTGEKA